MPNLTVDHATTQLEKCTHCRAYYIYLFRYVLKDGDDYAAVFAEAHTHNNEREIYFIVTLGMNNPRVDMRRTFSCRYGYVENLDEFACSLTDVPETIDEAIAGKRLTRKQALKNSRLKEMWEVVDHLIDTDIVIHDFLNHTFKSKAKALLRLYQ